MENQMNISDFIAGRSNKIARDFLFTSITIVAITMVGFGVVRHMVGELKVAQSEKMPARIQTGSNGSTSTMMVTRSVLDEVITTGSINGRPLVIDPCTGKEKK
jgi:hypothetical protein